MRTYQTERKTSSRKKVVYIGSAGFKRRLRWARPFVVSIHKLEVLGVSA